MRASLYLSVGLVTGALLVSACSAPSTPAFDAASAASSTTPAPVSPSVTTSTQPSPESSDNPTTDVSTDPTDTPSDEGSDDTGDEKLVAPVTNAARFVEQLGRIAVEHGDSMDYSDFGVPAAWVEVGGWPARGFGLTTPTTIDSGAVRGSLEVDRPYLPYAVVDTTGRCAAGVVFLNRDQLDFLTGPAPVGASCAADEATTALAAEIDQ